MTKNMTIKAWKRTATRAMLTAIAITGLGLTGCDKDQVETAATQPAAAMSPSQYLASGMHQDA